MGSCRRSMIQKGSRRRAAGQQSVLARIHAAGADDHGQVVVLRGGPFADTSHWVTGSPVVIVVPDRDPGDPGSERIGRSNSFYVRRDDGQYEYRPDAAKILAAIAREARAADDD